MNLLRNLFYPIFAFLLIAFVFWWLKRARFCLIQAKRRFLYTKIWWRKAKIRYYQAKRWWKKDWKTKLTELDANLEKIWKFLETHKNSFSCFAVIMGGIIVFVLLFVTLWTLPWVKQGDQGLDWTPWGEVISRITAPLLVFILGLLAYWRIFRQFQVQVKQVGDQAKNASKQIAAEQFKNAVDHLGSKKQAVVLGGVHALHNLATTFPKEYSKQVFEVLCSFIREETGKQDYQDQVEAKLAAEEESRQKDAKSQKTDTESAPIPTPSKPTEQPRTTSLIVIQTIIDKLFREDVELEAVDKETGKKLILYRNHQAKLSEAFLRGVNFREAHLEDADLTKANLQGVHLTDANLQEARLNEANLQINGTVDCLSSNLRIKSPLTGRANFVNFPSCLDRRPSFGYD